MSDDPNEVDGCRAETPSAREACRRLNDDILTRGIRCPCSEWEPLPCGHASAVHGCGGCDPGAIDYYLTSGVNAGQDASPGGTDEVPDKAKGVPTPCSAGGELESAVRDALARTLHDLDCGPSEVDSPESPHWHVWRGQANMLLPAIRPYLSLRGEVAP